MTKNRTRLKWPLWDKILKNLRTELKERSVNALKGNQKLLNLFRKDDRMLQCTADFVEPKVTPPVSAERRYETKKSRSYKTKLQPRKKVTFTHNYKKGRGPFHGSGTWTSRSDDNGALMSTPQPDTRGNFRPSNHSYDNFSRNPPFKWTGYSNNNNDRFNDYKARSPYQSNQDQSRNWRSNKKNQDRLQRRDKIHPSRIFAVNPDQIQLIPQSLTDLESKTRTNIYPTTRISQLPTMVTSQK